MEKKILVLDFDASYKDILFDQDRIVLSSTYENAQTLDVRKFKADLNKDIDSYTKEWERLIEQISYRFTDTLKASECSFFRACINPMSRWIEAIKYCFSTYNITEVIFTSYSKNPHIFVYEAEGEINKKLFYKENYYIPYYLKIFIKAEFNKDVVLIKKNIFLSIRFKSFLRNILLLHFVLFKQLFFRFTTFKRSYGIKKDFFSTIISSRAIVQTEFISNYQKLDNSSVLIVNEQSFSLLKHLSFLKFTKKKFLYAEGLIYFKDFIRIISNYFIGLWILRKNKQYGIQFNGMTITVDKFLPDLLTKELDYVFYATSIKNAIKKFTLNNSNAKLLSFEMFTSYAYYLKKHNLLKTFQIQTTLIEPVRNANFIVSDYFFFTNPITHKQFVALNPVLKHKIGCIPYLKYVGCNKKELQDSIHSIVYFSQPTDLEEEKSILIKLDSFCVENSIRLTIKPHPRQLTKFDFVSAQTIILNSSTDVEELILNSDVVITRSSSIGLDAWIYGVPPLFPKLNTPLQQLNIFYAPNDYEGTVFSLEEMIMRLEKYTKLKQKFLEHRLFEELNELSSISPLNLFEI